MAFGLPWTPGDNVVGIARDFPSNRVVWEALDGLGVEFRAVDINLATDPEIALIAACDRRTRVLAVSWVHYVTGLRLDLERLGSHCRGRGILLCIDAIQGLGALRLDVQARPAGPILWRRIVTSGCSAPRALRSSMSAQARHDRGSCSWGRMCRCGGPAS